MTSGAVSWVPAGTMPPAGLDARFSGVVEDWSRAWVVGSGFRATAIRAAARRLGEGGSRSDNWRSTASSLALLMLDPAPRLLGLVALGVTASDQVTDADRALADLISADMAADLERRLAAFAELTAVSWADGASDIVDAPATMIAEITTVSHDPVARVAFGAPLFARLVCQSLPAVAPIVLGQPRDSLMRHSITVSALLGRTALSLAELEELTEGDVVVLDRCLGEALPLAIDGVAAPTGKCRVIGADNTLTLEITAAPAGGMNDDAR